MSLAGTWSFRLNGPKEGVHPGVLTVPAFKDSIELPGTTDTRQKGPDNGDRSTESLSQPHRFEGTCWYQRDLIIPPTWSHQRLSLFLERTKYTQVWLDGKPIGENALICTPQEYELSHDAQPGRHTLTIAVDNKRLPPFGADSHQTSGNTQGNWNGIIGRIELRATDKIHVTDLQVIPSVSKHLVHLRIEIHNELVAGYPVTLRYQLHPAGINSTKWEECHVNCPRGTSLQDVPVSVGSQIKPWDEFHPNLGQATIQLLGKDIRNEVTTTFGMRTFATEDHQFKINGQTTFLRGKHDGCVFPITGHPPMDVNGWLKYFKICREYGLNHVRFHTWTPPEAAFQAADRLGFYLQAELPYWGNFDAKAAEALKPEALQILRRFGNHPSFVMFSMGNEHWGTIEVLDKLVGELKQVDSRRLFARGTNAISWLGHPGQNDDYLITADVHNSSGKAIKVRAANAGRENWGHVQTGPANTETDYREATATTDLPVVTHEMGQFTTFPNYAEIKKYTGVSKPYNLERFQTKLKNSGMLPQDLAFCRASGFLAALCYREEIEACLRTPKHGGFELLDLQDYPGQGTALVGILDAFMQSKGAIEPSKWRQFCSPVVILARFPKYVWTQGETFSSDIDVAHYGERDLPHAQIDWSLSDSSGIIVDHGALAPTSILRGGLRTLQTLRCYLEGAGRYTLRLAIRGTAIETTYPLWVYAKATLSVPRNLTLARSLNQKALEALESGGRVLLVTDGRRLARSVGGGFATDFWCFPMFHDKPGTMGLICDPSVAALRTFPTESHSNWQWFDIALAAQPLVLDEILPKGQVPIVQIIDNLERCEKLGLIFELKVGRGKLLVCASDLVEQSKTHPESAQLLQSLIAYAGSDKFQPKTTITEDALRALFQTAKSTKGWTATASSFDDNWKGYRPQQLIDENDARMWKASPSETGPAWVKVDFPHPLNLQDGEIVWANSPGTYRYVMESSTDGSNWTTLSDQTSNSMQGPIHVLKFAATGVLSVRIRILDTPKHEPAAIGEIKFYTHDR